MLDHLPEHAKPHVRQVMQDAHARDDADTAQVAVDDEPDGEHVLDGAPRVAASDAMAGGSTMARWALAGTMEAEKSWRRLMGRADMPELVTALRRLDLARAARSATKRAA